MAMPPKFDPEKPLYDDFLDHHKGSKVCSICTEKVYWTKSMRENVWESKEAHSYCVRQIKIDKAHAERRAKQDLIDPPEKVCAAYRCINMLYRRPKERLREWKRRGTCCPQCSTDLRLSTLRGETQRRDAAPAETSKAAAGIPPGWGGGFIEGPLGPRHGE